MRLIQICYRSRSTKTSIIRCSHLSEYNITGKPVLVYLLNNIRIDDHNYYNTGEPISKQCRTLVKRFVNGVSLSLSLPQARFPDVKLLS